MDNLIERLGLWTLATGLRDSKWILSSQTESFGRMIIHKDSVDILLHILFKGTQMPREFDKQSCGKIGKCVFYRRCEWLFLNASSQIEEIGRMRKYRDFLVLFSSCILLIVT